VHPCFQLLAHERVELSRLLPERMVVNHLLWWDSVGESLLLCCDMLSLLSLSNLLFLNFPKGE
jgi:hypothetical protein